ncbi:hypothetical protein B0T10DRAFT_543985 [Thelonectria olida]|uniref:Fucose-specific lectin n=1 Tax=Thelonectria olida TaxID=1576542 RepID=A0A9P8WDG2_9HYPO|nr:hypothetical protein B0T10DRAFT_543985 [Thelonectria olida]
MTEATSPPRPDAEHCDLPIPVHDNSLPIPVNVETAAPPSRAEKEAFQAERDLKEVALTSYSPPSRTICGFSRKTFYIALVVAIVLVAAVVGGTVGGLQAKKNNGSDSADSSTSTTATSTAESAPAATSSSANLVMHPQSQIATTNWTSSWTDRNASQQSFVVFQDPNGAIMMAAWDDDTTLWSSINVTDRLQQSRLPFKAKIGTPLAATSAVSFHIVLYFLQTDNRLVEVHSNVETLDDWELGDLYKANVKVDNGTRIAADWFMCSPDCNGGSDGVDQNRIFFSEDNELKGYSNVPWVQVDLDAKARSGSGVGAVPFVPPSGPMEMRLFFDTGSKLGLAHWTNSTGWASDNSFSGNTHATFSGQQIVATSFATETEGEAPAWVVMALQLEKDGSLAASYWDPKAEEWNFGKAVSLKGGPKDAAFSMIAVDYDRKFYGVIDGEVYGYRIDRDDPTRLVYTAEVALQGGE